VPARIRRRQPTPTSSAMSRGSSGRRGRSRGRMRRG